MTALEPERLLAGRYRLDAIIDRGGMGAVWRAHDELLNRDVAVKEIVWPPQMDAAEREAARRRAVREAQMAARIHHPNVVRVYDILEDSDRPCIVMELVSYPSLRDVLRQDGPLSPADAARVGLGVLAALRAAHEVGVVHRDVKPANILIGPRGRIVLADFGIAKSIDSPALTASGVLVGSPAYIAPERARGGSAGTAADLWGLGASLYAAVEGQAPFQRGSVLASLTAVVADEPDPPAHAGPLEPVINGLLRKDPGARLGTDEAEQLLRRIAGEEQLIPGMRDRDDSQQTARLEEVALPPAAATGRGGPRRTHPRLAALAAAAAIIAIVAGIAFLAARPHSHQTASRTGLQARPTTIAPTSAVPAPAPRASSARAHSASSAPAHSVSTTPARAPTGSPPGASGHGGVPAGYYRFTDPTGFSIGVPAGWQISHVGHYVYIRDPANRGIFLIIDQSDQPKPDPLADWRQQASARQSSYPGYRLIMLRAIRYPQAQKAADWEFSYDSDGVVTQVLNRNILANAHHAYALYWSTPASQWDANYHFFQVFAATFQPAGPLRRKERGPAKTMPPGR
jgi:eukaryotic-like serine/threonine-protein kinase